LNRRRYAMGTTGGHANREALVSTDWLEQHLNDPDIQIVEVDEDTTAYEKGHIQHAVAWNWNTDLKAAVGRDFIDQAGLTALLRAAGVGGDTTVVLYGGNNNWFAAYAYWLLKYLAFDPVKLLDGGRKKWELESRMVTDEIPSFAPGDVSIDTPVREELRAFLGDVRGHIGQGAFVDVRSPEEYRGEALAPPHLPQEQAQVPGHIPGAVNVTWSKAANEDGTFRSTKELRALYEGAGVTPERSVIAYCRIGERSSHTWFVLHELLGYGDVKNYDGSWTEYGSLVREPVEKG
jgi:thiosulfate/3-mercaptopyruvate sulfurtransferase